MRRITAFTASLTCLALAGCLQDFEQFRGGGGGGTGGNPTVSSSSSSSTGGGGAGGGVDPCDTLDCDDDNPCTADSCAAGACVNEPTSAALEDVAPICRDTACVDGEVGEINDDTEVPDDGNECTTDSCSGGAEVHTITPGADCGVDQTCNASGQCSCNVDADCGANPACGTWDCTTVCVMVPAAASATPISDPTDGDCRALFCTGAASGLAVEQNFAGDPASDNDDCTQDVCNGANTEHPFEDDGVACSGGFCDGAGNCEECTQEAHCAGNQDCRNNECCESVAVVCGSDECGTQMDDCGNNVSCGMCTGGTPVCDAGNCVECLVDNDCVGQTGTLQCATAGANAKTCVECDADAQCMTAGQTQCATSGANLNTCVECDETADCGANEVCSTLAANRNTCIECNSATDCADTPATPQCSSTGVCVECTSNTHCASNGDGAECINNVCGCNGGNNDADCAASSQGRDCKSGSCGCDTNPDCQNPNTYTCQSGVCLP